MSSINQREFNGQFLIRVYYPFGLTFNSYQRENSVDQKYKFQGQEHIDDLGLNWDSFKWRNHQPDIGRFFNIDPLAESYYYNSPYAFSENKVTAHVELEGLESWYAADGNVVHGPVNKKTVQALGLRAAQGVSAHAGYTGIQAERARNQYNKRLTQLAPGDSKGRTQAKVDAREKTPAIARTMAEKMRPMSEEGTRTGGTANKSNENVNRQVKKMGNIGKISAGAAGAMSVYNVATAEDKGQAVVTEGASLGGAIVGGEIGAEIGSIGGVPGAILGGFIGSMVGSIVGGQAVEGSMSAPPTQNNYDSNGNYLVPKDATNRIQIDRRE